ncbi:MAG: crotonase/enoyl-CoA hydratase family protein [Beijerinckiaceae bacterium]
MSSETRSETRFETIRYEVSDCVALLSLHRPDKLNAFTPLMGQEMIAAFDLADADDDVRAVIVTGTGRGFCAGADLSQGGKTFDSAAREDLPPGNTPPKGMRDLSDESVRDGGGRVTLRIFASRKPVIAAVNGPAVGIGATMLLPMDIRLAAQEARFGFVFVRRGLVPEACSSWFLPRVVGVSQALEWTLSGRVFSAAEALKGGLVKEVLPQQDLLPAARALAREIAENTAPVSVALSRQMMWRMLGATHPMEAHRLDSRLIFQRGKSADAKEGVTSFLEKRPAHFPDKVSRDMPTTFPWWEEPDYE